MDVLNRLAEQICLGQQDRVRELVQKAIEHDIAVSLILTQGLIPGMDIVGGKISGRRIFYSSHVVGDPFNLQSLAHCGKLVPRAAYT